MADVGISVGGSVSGTVIVGDHNVIVRSGLSEVAAREGPPPRPVPRRPLGFASPRPGPEPIGRDAELREIRDALDQRVPVEVVGPPGIGKSLLLRAVAAECGAAGTEVVFLPAAGLPVEDIVQELFQACYETEGYKPDTAHVRRLMGAVRAVLVVDDVLATPDEIAVLLDAVPSSSLLIASLRGCLGGEGRTVEPAGLGEEDALSLVRRELGRSLSADERDLVETFRRDAAGHPLALVQAARAIRSAADRAVLPDRQALATALATGLDERARAVLALLLTVDPVPVPGEHVAKLADAEEALDQLVGSGVVTREPEGFRVAQPIGHLVARAAEPVPDPGGYAQRLAAWAADAPAERIAAVAALIVSVLAAALADQAHLQTRTLARAVAPALCLTLRWGAWRQALALGGQASHALGSADDRAYFEHEDKNRRAALGKGALAGAAAGVAFWAGRAGAAGAKKGTSAGPKGCLTSPAAVGTAAAAAIAGLVGAVGYVLTGNPAPSNPVAAGSTSASITIVQPPPVITPTSPTDTSPTDSSPPDTSPPDVTPTETSPTPVPSPAPPAADVRGTYTMSRRLVSCTFEICYKEPLTLRIGCAGDNCVLTGDGIERLPLTLDGDTMTAAGPDGRFNICGGRHRPGRLALTLTVTSWRPGRGDTRQPNTLAGRLTTSSPAFGVCRAGDAAWTVTVTRR
ncbi:hypothetical protein [Actinomadura gamaensis]|uniref:AAA+ ATPase domain-containing protein n=1 Tax=Actinomadura gamaensis TaxID=1763541 RepID=A0ABV9TZZ6_9ACTN